MMKFLYIFFALFLFACQGMPPEEATNSFKSKHG